MRKESTNDITSDITINDMNLELVGLSEVADMLLTRKQQAHRWSRRDDFPAPLAKLRQGPVWDKKDIEKWALDRGYVGILNNK